MLLCCGRGAEPRPGVWSKPQRAASWETGTLRGESRTRPAQDGDRPARPQGRAPHQSCGRLPYCAALVPFSSSLEVTSSPKLPHITVHLISVYVHLVSKKKWSSNSQNIPALGQQWIEFWPHPVRVFSLFTLFCVCLCSQKPICICVFFFSLHAYLIFLKSLYSSSCELSEGKYYVF